MRKFLKYIYKKFYRQDIEDFDPKIDLDKLLPAEKINMTAGCIDLMNKGIFAKIVAHRANALKLYISKDAFNWDDVEFHRARLLELDKLVSEIKRLGQKPHETLEIVDKFATF
jgi:hypothetical protein